mgnify:CR=1 FL=1
MPDVKQRMIDIVNSVPEDYFEGLKPTEMVFKLMFEYIDRYGKVCTLEELKQHIDELEARHANNNIKWRKICNYRYIFNIRQDKTTFFKVHKNEIFNFLNQIFN